MGGEQPAGGLAFFGISFGSDGLAEPAPFTFHGGEWLGGFGKSFALEGFAGGLALEADGNKGGAGTLAVFATSFASPLKVQVACHCSNYQCTALGSTSHPGFR